MFTALMSIAILLSYTSIIHIVYYQHVMFIIIVITSTDKGGFKELVLDEVADVKYIIKLYIQQI